MLLSDSDDDECGEEEVRRLSNDGVVMTEEATVVEQAEKELVRGKQESSDGEEDDLMTRLRKRQANGIGQRPTHDAAV